jgi:Family of unknown function (DUF6516)
VDVWEYFQSRERECRELSLAPDEEFSKMCAEAEGSNGQRGIFFGRLVLSERAFLSVYEIVQVTGTGIHRERYSYYLIIDGLEYWGYDRDPGHEPPIHRHTGTSHRRHPCRRMTFAEVAQQAWETVSAVESTTVPPAAD